MMGVHGTFVATRTIQLGLSVTDRFAVEAEIERLISLLDALDGDCDIEDDQEDDPLDHGELDEGALLDPPIHGGDQTAGPLNEREAYHAYQRRELERGGAEDRRRAAERSARGIS